MKLHMLLLGTALTAACGDVVEPADNVQASWSLDHATDDGVLLGVWGSSPEDVWVVGGQVDRAVVLHGDGVSWRAMDVSATSLLNNVYGFSDHDVYAVGEHGLILHWDGIAWQQVESGTDLTLNGVWGVSGDDVWIVGGRAGATGSIVLRGSHGVFRPVEVPAELTPSALFKVHGFASDDVVMVGSDGVLRWDGVTWRRDAVPVTEPLFSTWGRGGDDVYAVGGLVVGEILHFDGQAWREVMQVASGQGLSGVFTSDDGMTYAVGPKGLVLELDQGGAATPATLPELPMVPMLHAVWGDDAGTTYTVGGTFQDYPASMSGLIIRRQ